MKHALALVALVAIAAVSAASLHGDAERARIIATVNKSGAKWTAGVNSRFAGKPIHAVKRQLGVRDVNPPAWKRPPYKVHTGFDIAALPDNFDSRQNWPSCPSIQEVRDQSDCGSCWAFGAVEAATDRICIGTNATKQAHLSAEDLTGCCSACGYGCDGGDPGSAWNFLSTTGIVTGGNYGDNTWCSMYSLPWCDHHLQKPGKYQPCPSQEYPTPACPSACDANSTYPTAYGADKHVFASAYSVPADPVQIQQEIMTNGPVEVAFTVYADFETYTGGIYHHVTGDELGGHAVKMLGWGVENGTPYWIVANSWNSDWGEGGFFRILRGSDECGIEDYAVAGMYL